MYAALFAPQATMSARFESASRHQGSNLDRVDHNEVCKLPLNMRWVVDTDDNGNRRLCMHWTVAPPPAIGQVSDPGYRPAGASSNSLNRRGK